MLLNVIEKNGFGGIWNELDRIHDELSNSFFSGGISRDFNNPPVSLYTNKEELILSALVPGYSPESIEISILENTVEIKAERRPEEIKEGMEVHRQEITNRGFKRVIELPYRVDSNKASASFKNGILSISLPKSEADKPRKINIVQEN